MADGITVTQISGLETLLRRLDQVPLVLSREVARDGLQEAGEVIQAAAEANAAEHRRTGDLEEDIIVQVQVSSDLRKSRVVVGPGYPGPGVKTRKRGRYAGQQDTTTSPGIYAKFVELGHGKAGYSWRSRYGSAKQRRRNGVEVEFGSHDVPPHPWLKPAFDASADEAVEVLTERTREALDRIDQLIS
jgi:HK97 gp10 family phage protein